MSRFACVWVPFFAAAAVERCEPALRERPLAVTTGAAPATRVVDANATARERGVRPGLTDAEAGARCPALVRRPLAAEAVASARHALLEACLAVSPRVEDGGDGLALLDVTGLERLVGPDEAVARALARGTRAVGLEARVGVARTRAWARVAARAGAAIHVLAPGAEPAALATVPLSALALPDDVAATLARWGARTVGALAALPREGLAMRLGAPGLAAHDLACGVDREPFRPWAPEPFWEEAQGLDWEIDTLGALEAPLRAALERLAARLAAAHRWADALEVRLALASRGHHMRAVPLAAPMDEVGPMLTLLRLDLEAHPPPAAVVGLALRARVVPRRPVTSGLWHRPAPATRDLAAVLARLVSLVGGDNVGAPVVLDSHRPDAFALAPFAPSGREPGAAAGEAAGPRRPDGASDAGAGEGRLAFRRLRPPRRVDVETDAAGRPAVVRGALSPAARVTACAGPWRLSGEWWDARAWARDEWDVAFDDGALCRLARDRVGGAWVLDGVYD